MATYKHIDPRTVQLTVSVEELLRIDSAVSDAADKAAREGRETENVAVQEIHRKNAGILNSLAKTTFKAMCGE